MEVLRNIGRADGAPKPTQYTDITTKLTMAKCAVFALNRMLCYEMPYNCASS